MTQEYVAFLRRGVTCACGCEVTQPLLRAPNVAEPDAATATAARNDPPAAVSAAASASSRSSDGVVIIDASPARTRTYTHTDANPCSAAAIDLTDDAEDEGADAEFDAGARTLALEQLGLNRGSRFSSAAVKAAATALAHARARSADEAAAAETMSCDGCGTVFCAACGVRIDSPAPDALDLTGTHTRTRGGRCGTSASRGTSADHKFSCQMRFVHAAAMCVERLRRVYTSTDPVVAMVDALDTLVTTGTWSWNPTAPPSKRRKCTVVPAQLAQQLRHSAAMLDEIDQVRAHMLSIADMVAEMEAVAGDNASAGGAKHLRQQRAQARGKDKSSGTGYAGDADDSNRLLAAEAAMLFRTSVRDRLLAKILQVMRSQMPPTYCDEETGAPCYPFSHASSGPCEVNHACRADGATDHPLLVQMLLLPGFGDGLSLAASSVASASGAAAAAPASIPVVASPSRASGAARKKGKSAAAAPPPDVEEPVNSRGLLTAAALRCVVSAAASAPSKPFGNGDGILGGSVVLRVLADVLRTSVMDMGLKHQIRRQLFFTLLELLPALSEHPDAAAILGFRDEDRASAATFAAWVGPERSASTTAPPSGCIASLLEQLTKQASVFLKNSRLLGGDVDVIVGDDVESAEYDAVVNLAQHVSKASRRAAHAWQLFLVEQATMRALDASSAVLARDASGMQLKRARSAAASASSAAAAPVAAPTAAAARASQLDLVVKALPSIQAASQDPSQELRVGFTSVLYRPDAEVSARYERIIKGQAYDTVSGIMTTHRLRNQTANSAVQGVGAASMKRHMRVSAELAALPDLATHWASSIAVRQDEGSMDYLRVLMVGPADTPYMNGCFLFDVFLPAAYPDVNPQAVFITTASGYVRFNPNLYADGKVCLSLLGTWAGPGWIPGKSTLSQLLLSIQGQILVDIPFANEPGFEERVRSREGKRAVARHNVYLRLATLRHAILDQVQTPPREFAALVRAHFYLKRDEIMEQALAWLADALALASYETVLYQAYDRANAAYLAQESPFKAVAGSKRPAHADLALAVARDTAYNALASWARDSDIHSHSPFPRGLTEYRARTPEAIMSRLPARLQPAWKAIDAASAQSGRDLPPNPMLHSVSSPSAQYVFRTMRAVVIDVVGALLGLAPVE